MTPTQEAAMRQALEVLEDWDSPVALPAMVALKAALTEPTTEYSSAVEPVAWMHTDAYNPKNRYLEWSENRRGYLGDWIKTPLYTAPPQRKPEPNSDYERGFVDGMSEQARRSVDKAVNAMIKCKPLAEEEIARLVTNDMVKFARAIERAHGIGANDAKV